MWLKLQKIRTIEQDGKTIKLQIVSFFLSLVLRTFIWYRMIVLLILLTVAALFSGILLDRSVSGLSLAATIEELMASLWAIFIIFAFLLAFFFAYLDYCYVPISISYFKVV